MKILEICAAAATSLSLSLGCSGAVEEVSIIEPGAGGVPGLGATRGVCDEPDLVWRTANKTSHESHPDPNSEACIDPGGCAYAGQLAACTQPRSKDWLRKRNIAAVFPDAGGLALHELCLKAGSKTFVVSVLDECNDEDCAGCCTRSRGTSEQLIDLERYTDERFGIADGPILWADLGQLGGEVCD